MGAESLAHRPICRSLAPGRRPLGHGGLGSLRHCPSVLFQGCLPVQHVETAGHDQCRSGNDPDVRYRAKDQVSGEHAPHTMLVYLNGATRPISARRTSSIIAYWAPASRTPAAASMATCPTVMGCHAADVQPSSGSARDEAREAPMTARVVNMRIEEDESETLSRRVRMSRSARVTALPRGSSATAAMPSPVGLRTSMTPARPTTTADQQRHRPAHRKGERPALKARGLGASTTPTEFSRDPPALASRVGGATDWGLVAAHTPTPAARD